EHADTCTGLLGGLGGLCLGELDLLTDQGGKAFGQAGEHLAEGFIAGADLCLGVRRTGGTRDGFRQVRVGVGACCPCTSGGIGWGGTHSRPPRVFGSVRSSGNPPPSGSGCPASGSGCAPS